MFGLTEPPHDGEFIRTQVTGEDIQRRRDHLIALHDAISTQCEIIPRQAPETLPESVLKMLDMISEDLADSAMGAIEGGVLLTEDMYFRQFAAQDFGVPGVWLQAVFMYAADEGYIDIEEYTRLVAALAKHRHLSLSVSGAVLAQAATLESEAGTATFRAVAELIGTRDAEMQSHVSVAYNAAQTIWNNESLPELKRTSCIGALLSNLIRFRQNDWELAMGTIYIGSSSGMRRYIDEWARGHFLSLERLSNGAKLAFRHLSSEGEHWAQNLFFTTSPRALQAGLS